jgi:ribosomal protein L2
VDSTKLLQPGDYASLSNFEPGDFLHAVEAYPGQGAVFARAAGTFCQVRSLTQDSSAVSSSNNGKTSN